MTDPLPLPPSRRDPLDNPVLQRDAARDLAAILEERNEKALRLHVTDGWGLCEECSATPPCPTVRALTGAGEDAA